MSLHPVFLPHRGIIKISGVDRVPFLQGLITNDIHKLDNMPVIYACLLSPQGRFLFDFFIYNQDDYFLLECEGDRVSELIKKLSIYKLRSQVTLEDVSSAYCVIVGDSIPELPQDPRLPELGVRGIVPAGQCTSGDVTPYTARRITLGVPEGGVDLIVDKSIPLENGLDELNAIDWQKGCYVGQELTSRTKYTGIVRKRLFPVDIEGPRPAFGEAIDDGGDKVGEMRSSFNNKGLALIRLEAFEKFQETGIPFQCGESRLKPYNPGWMLITQK